MGLVPGRDCLFPGTFSGNRESYSPVNPPTTSTDIPSILA